MKSKRIPVIVTIVVVLAVLDGRAITAQDTAQDKYTVQVPDGLAFSEFRGYETWQVVAVSQTDELLKVIAANPVMIEAYRAGIPGNGKPFPDELFYGHSYTAREILLENRVAPPDAAKPFLDSLREYGSRPQ